MAKKKSWRGVQVNHCQFQGEITEEPTFNGDYAFLKLKTVVVQRDTNGQFVEIDQEIPLMVEPGGPINVVKNHIKASRLLLAWCHYKSWQNQGALQHGFVVRKFDLGDKPYEGPVDGTTPPLPTS